MCVYVCVCVCVQMLGLLVILALVEGVLKTQAMATVGVEAMAGEWEGGGRKRGEGGKEGGRRERQGGEGMYGTWGGRRRMIKNLICPPLALMGGAAPRWRDIALTMVVGETTEEGEGGEGVGGDRRGVRPGGGAAVGAGDPI